MKKNIEIEKIYSLSPMQEGILFHYLLDRQSHAYFEQSIFTLTGSVDPLLLEESFNRVIERYDVLRSVFRFENVKKPKQVVLKRRRLKIHLEDITAMKEEEKQRYLETFQKNDRDKGFDLSKDLLIRVSLFKTAENTFKLVWSFPHIIMDGWCVGIIFRDLIQAYQALKKKSSLQFEPVIPYKNYINWLKQQDRDESLNYWEKYLEGYEQTATLPKFAKRGNNAYRVHEYSLAIEEKITRQLNQLARENHTTLNLVFETLWGILLQGYNNTDDVVFGTVVSGRPPGMPGVEKMVGLFVNTIPVRVPAGKELAMSDFIRLMKQKSVLAKPHEYLPLPDIQALSPLKNRLIDILVGFENYPIDEEVKGLNNNLELGFKLVNRESHEQTNYDFNVIVIPGKQLVIRFNFNSYVYREDFVEKIGRHIKELMVRVVENPGMVVGELQCIPKEEKQVILYEFNRTKRSYPCDKTVHRLFAEQVERTPHRTAVSAPFPLDHIYDALEAEQADDHGVKALGTCCFEGNPHVVRQDLLLTGTTGTTTPCILLKTQYHNSVVVNTNLLALIDCFNGEHNTASIFSVIKDMHLEFFTYSINSNDLLDITFNFSPSARIFSNSSITEFFALIQWLYRNHLVRLKGVSEDFSPVSSLNKDQFKENEYSGVAHPWGKQPHWLSPGQSLSRLEQVEVLLLGDTPGMPTTGLLYLAAYLKRNGIQAICQFYDPTRDNETMKQNIEMLLEKTQPRVVAVSLKWFLFIARVLEICKIVKTYAARANSPIKVVVGGNTASYYWQDLIKYEFIDYVVRGDGEEPLLKLCQDPENPAAIPNIVYSSPGEAGEIQQNPITYIQDKANASEIYLSHLDEILLSPQDLRLGTFYIYTHRGCAMNCFYCGGCKNAQRAAFNRETVFHRPEEAVRRDILAALEITTTFQFDFAVPGNDRLMEYCRQIWEGIDLSSHFCIFSNIILPSARLIRLAQQTFNYVYCDIDIITLSERHRQQLASLGLVKPQPTDAEVLELLDQCETYNNVQVRFNLISGLPYFTGEDREASQNFLYRIMNRYTCFGELQWGRLHAQPGAPITVDAEKYNMYSYASSFEHFLQYSEKNFNNQSLYPGLEHLNYPYIYFNDDTLNPVVSRFYTETNLKLEQHQKDKKRREFVCKNLSFQQLNEKANQLARLLREKGIKPDSIIGLMVDRSVEMMVGIMGILKAGGAYLPIAPDNPGKRTRFMLKDSDASILLTKRNIFRYQDNDLTVEVIDLDSPGLYQRDQSPLPHVNNPHDLIHVLYTSGTTGDPNGVMLRHGSVVNFITDLHENIYKPFGSELNIALIAPFIFAGSVKQIFSSLLFGHRLVMVPEEGRFDGNLLIDFYRNHNIDISDGTPAHIALLQDAYTSRGIRTCAVKHFNISADILPPALVQKFLNIFETGKPNIMNVYGPTECCVDVTAYSIDPGKLVELNSIPIGTPMANSRIYILNKDFMPAPLGAPGEIHIAGEGLARGYSNKPELTHEKFKITNEKLKTEFHKQRFREVGRLYRTGDLGRWLPDGNVEYLGRIDRQIKIRGYRIELVEIEKLLKEIPFIKNALVTEQVDSKGEHYLCAYIVSEKAPVGQKVSSPKPTGESPDFKEEIITAEKIKDFEHQVTRYPDEIAVKSGSQALTYRMLDGYANRLARDILENYDDRYRLNGNEKARYYRQMLLDGWGVESQEKLKHTTAFVAGAGGMGSAALYQLALVGVGTIIICDHDEVELTNLNRQFLHDESRIGMNKALSAKMTINRVNPNVHVIVYPHKVTAENIWDLVGESDIIFDHVDDLATKFVLSRCAAQKQIPHVISVMMDINSYAAVFQPPETPCFHCLFEVNKLKEIQELQINDKNYKKKPFAVAAPSLFVSTGFICNEALKIIMGYNNPAYNKFILFNQKGATDVVNTEGYRQQTYPFSDHFLQICKKQGFDWNTGWRGRFVEELDIEPNPDCPVCGEKSREQLPGRKQEGYHQGKQKENAELSPAISPLSDTKQTVAVIIDSFSPYLAAAVMGVLKAGKVAIPLDPNNPLKWLTGILDEYETRMIISDNDNWETALRLRDKVNKNITALNVEVIGHSPGAAAPDVAAASKQPAAILYPVNSPASTPAGISTHQEMIEFLDILLRGDTVITADAKNDDNIGPHTYTAGQLREYLLKKLPAYMIPSRFASMEKIPLTPSGKPDMKALPEPGSVDSHDDDEYIAPQSETEKNIAAVCQEVLGVDRISTRKNLFEIGLDSIKAIQVSSAILNYGLKLGIPEILRNPTIEQLGNCIDKTEPVQVQDVNPEKVPLTPDDFTKKNIDTNELELVLDMVEEL